MALLGMAGTAQADDSLIVTTAPGAEIDAPTTDLTGDGTAVEVPADDASARELAAQPGVLSVEPNIIGSFTAGASIRSSIDDPLAGQEWALGATNWFALPFGFIPTGKVAVLDSGIDIGHPEFSGTLPDGRPKIAAGWSTSSDDDVVDDDLGHGTQTASLIAANTGNGEGIASISPGSQLMVIKVGTRFASATGGEPFYGIALSDAIQGIDWAVDHGAKVINISFAFPVNSPALRAAVLRAIDRGAVIVAAVGNDGCLKEGGANETQYPAAYPHVIGVAASNKSGGIACYSNQGPEVDLAAPGTAVAVATARGSRPDTYESPTGYGSATGTSFAAPIVSGAAALITAMHRTWNADDVRAALQSSATNVGARGWDQRSGAGLLNLERALASGRGQRDAFEVNDDVAVARDIPALVSRKRRQSTTRATIHRSNDPVDVYPVLMPRGSTLKVALGAKPGLRLRVTVWRTGTQSVFGNSKTVKRHRIASVVTKRGAARLSIRIPAGGQQYVSVTSLGSSGAYALRVTRT
jgi:subtilisin family serine protease